MSSGAEGRGRPARVGSVGASIAALLALAVGPACSGGGAGPGPQPAASGGAPRAAREAPPWFTTRPKGARHLYFAGDATGALDEGAARDLAIQKAIAELTVYCGASIKSDARSEEREANGKHEYVVSMTVDIAGDELTVREAVVKETVSGKGSDGLYDAYVLLEWPKEQYEAVLAMQKQRAARALALFLDAERAAGELDTVAASTALREGKAILGPMRSAVPLQHDRYQNTTLLYDAMKALSDRLEAVEQGRKGVVAVVVECLREGRPVTCNNSRAGAIRAAISRSGKKVSADAISAKVAADILSSETPAIDKSVRTAGLVVAVRYTADLQGTDGPFTFIRAGARGVVFDVVSGRIVGAHELSPQKEGHPSFEGAMEKAWNGAEKQLVEWVSGEVGRIK